MEILKGDIKMAEERTCPVRDPYCQIREICLIEGICLIKRTYCSNCKMEITFVGGENGEKCLKCGTLHIKITRRPEVFFECMEARREWQFRKSLKTGVPLIYPVPPDRFFSSGIDCFYGPD